MVMTSRLARSPLLLAGLLAATSACVDRATENTAVRRGDVAFAADSLDEALAEYRLALRQGSRDADVLARAAHTFAELGQVDEAADLYRQAADADPRWGDQAAADLMHLARRAAWGRERFRMATAVQEALRFRPGIGLGDLALPLARHHFQNGEYSRALPLYQRALMRADTVPEILFEIGQAYEEIGDCRRALGHYEAFYEAAPRSQRDAALLYIGSCALSVARELHEGPAVSTEDMEEARTLVGRYLEVGEPRSLQGEAYFLLGEIHAALGECSEAQDAFAQVLRLESVGGGALMTRARERFDLLRFGRGLESYRSDGRCY